MTRSLQARVERLKARVGSDLPEEQRILDGFLRFIDRAEPSVCEALMKILEKAKPGPAAAPPVRAMDQPAAPQPEAVADEPVACSPRGPESPREPPLQIPNLADPSQSWQFVINRPPPGPRPQVPDPPPQEPAPRKKRLPAYLQWQEVINKPPPGPRPPPPPPYRDPLDDPLGLYGEPTG